MGKVLRCVQTFRVYSHMIEEVSTYTGKPRLTRKKAPTRGLKPKAGKSLVSKKKKPLKAKKWKFVKTHLQECDDSFSREIRQRDGRCVFLGCEKTTDLTCSHYIGRSNWNLRFDEENADTLCTTHHFWDKTIGWEYQKQRKGEKGCDWDGRYTVYMRNKLGTEGFTALMERSKGNKSRKEAILETQKKYGLRQPETAETPQSEVPGSVVI